MSALLFLQKLREYINGQWNDLFLFITTLGEPIITFLFLGFVYWCVSKKTGLLMAATAGISCVYSHVFKYIFKVPRPWIKDPAIKPLEKALANAGGFSFPSGHSARAGAVWGTFGIGSYKESKNQTLLLTGIFISLAVAFSRLFLGVHSIKDVCIGLLMAYTICLASIFLVAWSEKGKNRDILISVLMIFLCFMPMLKFGCISTVGFGIGVSISWILEKRFLRFHDAANNVERAKRFIAGSIGIMLIQLWLPSFLTVFIPSRYCGFFSQFAMAFYILFAFPLIFTKIKKNWMLLLLAFFSLLLSQSFFFSLAGNLRAKHTPHLKALYEKPLLIGHRGYFANFPQNTMESFKGAVDIGVDMIELDVQMSLDGEIVIEHDNNLSRIGQQGSIADYTYSQLLQMDFGGWFNTDFAETKIATLSDLLEYIKDYPAIKVYIELKDIGENEDFVEKVYRHVKDRDMMEQCYFASFQKNYLAQFKKTDPACRTIYILSNYDSSTFSYEYVDIYSLYDKNISAEIINLVHKQKKPVFAWTVDDPLRVLELKKMGIDGICTNQAGRIKIALHDEYDEWMAHFETSSALPGLYCKNLPLLFEDAVYQGFTRAEEYMLITAYRKSNASSLLFVLSEKGEWISTFDLGFTAHTGGCAYDAKQNKLWITGASGSVCCIDWQDLKALIGSKHFSELIAAPAIQTSFDGGLVNHNGSKVASFMDIYNGFLYIGSYTLGCSGKLHKFDIRSIKSPLLLHEWEIPEKTQGITFSENDGQDYIYLSMSANVEDSRIEKYRLDDGANSLGTPLYSLQIPEGSEQIEYAGNDSILFLFESAALPYRATARIRNDQLWQMNLPCQP